MEHPQRHSRIRPRTHDHLQRRQRRTQLRSARRCQRHLHRRLLRLRHGKQHPPRRPQCLLLLVGLSLFQSLRYHRRHLRPRLLPDQRQQHPPGGLHRHRQLPQDLHPQPLPRARRRPPRRPPFQPLTSRGPRHQRQPQRLWPRPPLRARTRRQQLYRPQRALHRSSRRLSHGPPPPGPQRQRHPTHQSCVDSRHLRPRQRHHRLLRPDERH